MHTTREDWLLAAVGKLRERFATAGYTVPANLKVSCGFPGHGSRRKVTGECWTAATKRDFVHIFITPLKSEESGPSGVLETLTHELIHACLPPNSGHKKPFKEAMAAIGLEPPATVTTANTDLVAFFDQVVKDIGPYPHRSLVLRDRDTTGKQGCRLLKLSCACGLTVRITRKWLDAMAEAKAEPLCWLCDETMTEEAADDDSDKSED